MARRSGSTVEDAPVDEVVSEPVAEGALPEVSEPVAETAVEGGDSIEAPAEPSEAAEPDEVIDLSGLNAALEAVQAGDLSDLEKVDFSGVVTAYSALSRKGKAAATRDLDNRSKALLESGDFDTARVLLLANKATKTAKPKGETKPRTPADVTTPLVTKLAAFQLAYGALSANLPESVSEDWNAQVTALFESEQAAVESLRVWMSAPAETRGDEPKVSETAALAAKIAFKSSRKPYGARHDVGAHIAQVFADKESGTFMTDAEIAAAPSEEYADAKCSTSAVTARLNSVTEQSKPLDDGLSVETREDKFGVLKA